MGEMINTDKAAELLAPLRGMAAESPTDDQVKMLTAMARRARADAVMMTSIAGSGHPGGALSSIDIFLSVLAVSDIAPTTAHSAFRDRMIVSHGHTSAGVYAVLGVMGFFDREEAISNFRRAGSRYQGHIERDVPGIDWGTGNLGQGLAAGVGFALADRSRGGSSRVFVVMGDGEQPKGQLAEARRIASKERLSNITALIDANEIQICGRTSDVMPVDIRRLWEADGWHVIECQGHDLRALYGALRAADHASRPTVIICHTTMGQGVSFMQDTPEYHGKAASGEGLSRALDELGETMAEYDRLKAKRSDPLPQWEHTPAKPIRVDTGTPKTYAAADKMDSRGAVGAVIAETASNSAADRSLSPVLAFDCDLAGSVKLDKVAKAAPASFVQLGIQEHAAATVAGAASAAGVCAIWADFGVFGIDEVYNQQRLNDINGACPKTVLTHVGLDVGEDGMTHQCIDYVGAFRNFFGWKVAVPADPNQADRAARALFADSAPVCVAVGRGVHPIITKEDGTPFFGGDYRFEYGKIDVVRGGGDCTILAMGHALSWAVKAHELLKERSRHVQILHCATPLAMDADELIRLAGGRPVVTVEDHHVATGIGASAAIIFADAGAGIRLHRMGVSRYGDSGRASEVTARMGLSPEAIADAVEKMI